MGSRISFISGAYNALLTEFLPALANGGTRYAQLVPSPGVLLRVDVPHDNSDDITDHVATLEGTSAVLCGTIYNIHELRARLDHHFNALLPSTAEVLLSLYLHDSSWLLKTINGKFCMAIYDGNIFTLIRDKLGEEQVYYGIKDQSVVFSNSIMTIANTLGYQSILESPMSKVLETPVDMETMINGIHKVPAGSRVTIDIPELSVSLHRYWSPTPATPSTFVESELVEELLYLMTDAVKIRMPADSDYSAYLSGGLDSSFVTCMLSRLNVAPTRVYTTGWADLDPIYNEIPWAKTVAESVQSIHVTLEPTPGDFQRHYPWCMYILGEVKANAAHFTEYWIARAAHGLGDRTLFSGYGSDELLGGEVRYLLMCLDADRPNNAAVMNEHPMLIPYRPLSDKLASMPYDTPADVKYSELMKRSDDEIGAALLQQRVTNVFAHYEHLIDKMGATDLELTAPPLMDSAKLNKYWGIDKVCPFLDYRMVDFAFRLPQNMKIRDLITKYVLRKASEGVVPGKISSRPDKVGFAFPHNDPRYVAFLEELARQLTVRTGQPTHQDEQRGRYDRAILSAASREILYQFYADADLRLLQQ